MFKKAEEAYLRGEGIVRTAETEGTEYELRNKTAEKCVSYCTQVRMKVEVVDRD